METGTITEWLVKEGDAFAAGDIICMVETDKVGVSVLFLRIYSSNKYPIIAPQTYNRGDRGVGDASLHEQGDGGMDALSVGVTADALNAYQQFVNAFSAKRKATDARIHLFGTFLPTSPSTQQANEHPIRRGRVWDDIHQSLQNVAPSGESPQIAPSCERNVVLIVWPAHLRMFRIPYTPCLRSPPHLDAPPPPPGNGRCLWLIIPDGPRMMDGTLFPSLWSTNQLNVDDGTVITQATVDFEAQDEAVLAKILVPAGTPDVAVGTPMMVLIESADDAAAFKDFSAEAPPAAAAVEEAPAAEPTPAPAAAAPAEAAAVPAQSAAPGGRVAASPLAKLVSCVGCCSIAVFLLLL